MLLRQTAAAGTSSLHHAAAVAAAALAQTAAAAAALAATSSSANAAGITMTQLLSVASMAVKRHHQAVRGIKITEKMTMKKTIKMMKTDQAGGKCHVK